VKIAEIALNASIFFVFHAYLGYPISLYIIGLFKSNKNKKAKFIPTVTLIITAYNEEKRIKNKIENTLALKYPKDKLQVLIASDGSTDRTTQIATNYEKDGFEILSFPERRGKEHAQKDAIGKANGEILVFTDVATLLDPAGIDQVVSTSPTLPSGA
jgi:cellulose synthase/poly-beta-1,6-N-acetylglucosamine synthase-like glycosyltransferase